MEIKLTGSMLHQWDTARTVQITPDEGYTLQQVAFSCAHTASPIIVKPDADGVADIPDGLLRHSGVITVNAMLTAPNGKRTARSKDFPVEAAILPEDYTSGTGGGGGSTSKYSQPEWGAEIMSGAIAEEQTLISADGAFISMTAVSSYPEAGKEYTVIWNGTEYTCPAKEMDFDGIPCVGFGNDSMLGGAGTEDPFLIAVFPADMLEALGGITMYVFALDGSAEVVLQINGTYEILHKIDEKYIEGAKNTFILNGSSYGSLRTIHATEESDEYALGQGAIALGADAKASGEYATAFGDGDASGAGSFAVSGSTASGVQSFAARGGVASGDTSFATGGEARGGWSTAIGCNNVAKGNFSVAIGQELIAGSPSQIVMGRLNVEDSNNKYMHILGNGEANNRSNAHTIDWDGNGWFAGTVEGTALILKSPNGTRYKVTVSDNGTLSAAAL